MTTAPPPAHYGAVKGALASGFATAELHHLWGHDPRPTGTVAIHVFRAMRGLTDSAIL